MEKRKKARGKKVPRELGLSFEYAAWSVGIRNVCGVDEAGRGPLAGPVVAAAVILSPQSSFPGLADSKKLTPKKRDSLYGAIIGECIAYDIVSVGVVTVDEINIFQATMLAMRQAVEGLAVSPGLVFVDGPKTPPLEIPAVPLKGGDDICRSIAAASVLAKVSRDRQMMEYDELYPGYGFARHKGYGTKEHMDALMKLGPSPIHRRTFGPVKRVLGES